MLLASTDEKDLWFYDDRTGLRVDAESWRPRNSNE
jgi:hypothetical protein